jgi:uncharacterized membrane protein
MSTILKWLGFNGLVLIVSIFFMLILTIGLIALGADIARFIAGCRVVWRSLTDEGRDVAKKSLIRFSGILIALVLIFGWAFVTWLVVSALWQSKAVP